MPTLLITGANRGIGLELCKQYLEAGWDVHATCRMPEKAKALGKLAQQCEGKLSIYPLDVRNEKQLQAVKQALKKTPIDVLVNNAGVYGEGANSFGKSSDEAWEEAVAVNLLAPMKMMEHFVDNVGDSDKKTIANISSKMGSIEDNTSGGSYAYRATKAALNAVTVSAAHDLKHRKIKVLILHPGWVRTDMGGPNGELSVDRAATMLMDNINHATLDDSGKFLDIDGSIIPW